MDPLTGVRRLLSIKIYSQRHTLRRTELEHQRVTI